MSFISKVLTGIIGNKSDRDIKVLQPVLSQIKEKEGHYKSLSHDQLREASAKIRLQIKESYASQQKEIDDMRALLDGSDVKVNEREELYEKIETIEKEIDDIIEDCLTSLLPDAYALVKETARRFTENETISVKASDFDRQLATEKDLITIEGDIAHYSTVWNAGGNEIKWEMVHYDVQLIGGTILHQGKIAEMATGEGKTLVATLPVFLNALPGRGVHVVTVNNYLAKRDAEWMGPLYEFHGLSVDCIDNHQPNSEERREAYRADITFGTNNEFGFDYLRDNMATRPTDLVQRRPNFAIVDEVDSVLVDDARTPLIISGPVPKSNDQMFGEYKPKVERLYNAQRQFVTKILADAKRLLASSDKKEQEEGSILLYRAHKGLPKNKAIIKFLSEHGMKTLMQKTEAAYMQDNNKNMHIITDELYFVIDEKQNSIDLTEKGLDLISHDTGDKDFFVMPDIGVEVAEIEKMPISDEEKIASKDAMLQDYAVKSERVHTVNQLLKAYALFEKDVEYVVMDNKVKIVDEQTGRIMDGRRYSDGLHQAIEAKENVKVEAATQTFATITLQNYFRMYIKLAGMTGTAETEAKELWDIYKLDVVVTPTNRPIQRDDRDDLVYKTKREKYNAVIDHTVELVNQKRPVLVGTTSVEVSELLSRMLKMRNIKHNVLNAKMHQREADVVAEAGRPGTVTIATNMAGRGTDIKLPKEVKDAGGLAILGTERHDSRRVDRQLRGRAGRQGDPGSSQFYVSLEDDLMRMFGSERMTKVLDRLGLKEGEEIQHSMITKSIERAQRKVEENNFGIRKRLLEYDDVMNSQREVIYSKRRHALHGDKISVDFVHMMYDVAASIVESTQGKDGYEEFQLQLARYFSAETPVSEEEFAKLTQEELTDKVYGAAVEVFERRSKNITDKAHPVVCKVFEEQSEQYKSIVIPLTDGLRLYQVSTDLKKAYGSNSKEIIRSFLKMIMLITIDDHWKEHLRELDDLRQSVQNATLEQKDPLLIYKFESFDLFQVMLDKINKDIVSSVMKLQLPDQVQPQERPQAPEMPKQNMNRLQTNKEDIPNTAEQEAQRTAAQAQQGQRPKQQPVIAEKKVGRNEPCPCGSGKKYKNCHGK